MTIGGSSFDLSPIIAGIVALVGAALTWLSNRVKNAQVAAANTASAELKVAALVTSIAGKAWDTLSPELQKILADGKVTAEERAELEAVALKLARDASSQDNLAELASALGLPLPGLIAKIASMLLDVFTKAHDPTTTSVSALAFPVVPVDDEAKAEIDRLRNAAG
jgi:hypothetical protein